MKSKLKLVLTLTTAGGRTGTSELTNKDSKTTWSRKYRARDGLDPTVKAQFKLYDGKSCIDSLEIDGDAWRELESEGGLQAFTEDCCSGRSIEFALFERAVA